MTWAVSGFLSGLFVAGSFAILFVIFGQGWLAAIFIALINAILPAVIMGLTLAIGEIEPPHFVHGSVILFMAGAF